jgi:hypothetical protein
MHLQVPGFALARDQMASIAIGAYCAECRGATRARVAGGRAKQRIVVGAIVVSDYARLHVSKRGLVGRINDRGEVQRQFTYS